ncbi:MAG: TerC family protein [Solimonas sp.]
MDFLLQPELWIALITLAALEIVLGIDNIIFLSIMANKLPEHQRARARILGLAGACLTRIALLMSLAWVARLTEPLFHIGDFGVSGRAIILIGGGLFLLAKSALEIHESVEGHGPDPEDIVGKVASVSFTSIIIQIMILDIVFSLDSVITAVGMTDNIPVMVTAIVIAIGVMMFFSGPVGRFVERHPTIKILALSFLIMIGMVLIGEGMGYHVPKAYIYTAMAFSVGVELLNLRMRRKLDQTKESQVEL